MFVVLPQHQGRHRPTGDGPLRPAVASAVADWADWDPWNPPTLGVSGWTTPHEYLGLGFHAYVF